MRLKRSESHSNSQFKLGREAVDVLFVDEAAQMCLAAADAHRVQCLLGYNGMNPSRLGMGTFGSVSAFIASVSPMILLSAST